MEFKVADIADIPQVLALQSKYLVTNLSIEEQKEGFVTTPFTVVQLEEVIALSGLFLAYHNDELQGYAFAASWAYFSQWPMFQYMISRLPETSFQGHALNTSNTFQYGPICIDRAFRGTGLLEQLFEYMRLAMLPQYPIGITFINQLNPRSIAAHTQKLQLQVIEAFTYNEKHYFSLGFYTKNSVL